MQLFYFDELLLKHEIVFRLSFFVGLLSLMCVLELFLKTRRSIHNKRIRWINHLLLAIINSVFVRLLFPFAMAGIALWASKYDIGIFNNFGPSKSQPSVAFYVFTLIASLVALDLVIYWQHRIFHTYKPLWKLHSTHHSDIDLDASTAIRFHPIEIVLSFWVKAAVITILGAPVSAVILFEIILNGMAIFNHSNLNIPPRLERLLRRFVVTPNMHCIHHSIIYSEHNSNFGFNLSCWDRIFSTYTATPENTLTIGLETELRSNKEMNIKDLLLYPFK